MDEAAVAAVAEEHGRELLDWSWESVGNGRENRAEGLFEGLHGGRSIVVLLLFARMAIAKLFRRKGRLVYRCLLWSRNGLAAKGRNFSRDQAICEQSIGTIIQMMI